MLTVQQKDRRALKSQGGHSGDNLSIGFHVMKVHFVYSK